MRVILIRHAETEWNQMGILQGHMDSPLTARGLRETSALLTAFTATDWAVECVYTSPLSRARDMARRLAKHFQTTVVTEEALKEQAFGRYEGVSIRDLKTDSPAVAQALFAEDPGFCPPGGESLLNASLRIIHFLQGLQTLAAQNTVCLVSHGHVCQGVLALLCEGKIENFARYAHPNASYSVLEVTQGKCVTRRWGIATHLLKVER